MGNVVWIVNHYARLPSEPSGTRHYLLCKELIRLGWDARLIRSGRTPNRRSPRHPHVEDVDGVQVTTLSGLGRDATGALRVGDWGAFAAQLRLRKSTAHLPSPDVVLGSTVQPGAAWAARALAKRHSCPFVFEVRDLWPETLIALGATKRSSVGARALLRLERSLATTAALIVSPLSGVGEYMFERHGVPRDRFLWVSNGVDLAKFSDLTPPPESALQLQYFGRIGQANDVATIIDAVAMANASSEESIKLQVYGSGPDRERLIQRVTCDPTLAQEITFPEPVPSSEISQAMAWGNCLVLTVKDLPELYRYGISMNKLFDYLASGRWIVMSAGVTVNPIAEAPGLTVCDPSAHSLSAALVQISGIDPSLRNEVAGGNVSLAKSEFGYETLARKLSIALERVVADESSVGHEAQEETGKGSDPK